MQPKEGRNRVNIQAITQRSMVVDFRLADRR